MRYHHEDSEPAARPRSLLIKTSKSVEAAVIRQLLATYGIACQLIPHLSRVLPIRVEGSAWIKVFVPADRLSEARTILAEHRRQGFRAIRGGKKALPVRSADEPI